VQEEYNPSVAEHYAAYRPPLHRLILGKLLKPDEHFEAGLDIGCGTGYSADALSEYCHRVTGLDPSESMIEQAIDHPKVDYLCGSEDRLSELEPDSIDIVTFAGSIFYAKNEALYQQLLSVLRKEGLLLIYDFEVLLDEPLQQLGLTRESNPSDYQFMVDLSDWDRFKGESTQTEQVELSLFSEELSHLLLADSLIYELISDKWACDPLYPQLVAHFEGLAHVHSLKAKLYYARFRVL